MNPPQVAKCAHLCYKQKNCFSKFDYGNTKCVLCTKVLSSPSKSSLVNEESSINMYTPSSVNEIAGGKLLYNTGSPTWSSVMIQRGRLGLGREAQEGGDICKTVVIRIAAWHKPTQLLVKQFSSH